jgi:PIN domain nuclease of toxin-antitoxin system
MKYLLDTNILLPLIDEMLPRPPAHILAIIDARLTECASSAASLWEMVIKSRLGKLALPCVQESLPEACRTVGISVLPVSPAHAVTPVFPWPQTNDPFDRILLSICRVEGLQLLTTDRVLSQHPLAWRA